MTHLPPKKRAITFTEISDMDALVLIHRNETDHLYFAYTYFYCAHGFGERGRSFRRPVPSDWTCGDPIKYQKAPARTGWFKKKTPESEPVPQEDTQTTIHLGHMWLIRNNDHCKDVLKGEKP